MPPQGGDFTARSLISFTPSLSFVRFTSLRGTTCKPTPPFMGEAAKSCFLFWSVSQAFAGFTVLVPLVLFFFVGLVFLSLFVREWAVQILLIRPLTSLRYCFFYGESRSFGKGRGGLDFLPGLIIPCASGPYDSDGLFDRRSAPARLSRPVQPLWMMFIGVDPQPAFSQGPGR